MSAYYNEIEPYAAQWLRNLIAAGHIAPGDVDERSIEDVTPADLAGYTQCHFFAGIGVWSHAMRAAGWDDSRPAWTGSCPCQPFSAAGKGAGFADERHLWPAWQHLIAQCRPAVLFGEQVASKDAEPWIDLVHADLEGMGYAFGCVPFPSAGVGAPHIRDRTFWVADSCGVGRIGRQGLPSGCVNDGAYAGRIEGHDGLVCGNEAGVPRIERPGPTNGFWRAADWLGCTDGKWRPVEPGTFPLASGVANRVGRLRAYGNAINAEAARQFILAYREARGIIAGHQEQAA